MLCLDTRVNAWNEIHWRALMNTVMKLRIP